MTFFVDPYRFVFRAREAVRFPPGKAANTIRGALGIELKRSAAPSAYARIFEPKLASGPSGLADLPRPFVIRCFELDGTTVPAGGEFGIDVHGFDPSFPLGPPLATAFAGLAESGLGPRRGSVELVATRRPEGVDGAILLPVGPGTESASRLRIRFETPTELKVEGKNTGNPEFHALAARARDRVSNLRRFYQEGPLEVDFKGFGERARQVRLVRFTTRTQPVSRRSSRTGRTHELRGFTGEAEYEGEAGEFLPLLRAAWWTGVGRHTVWGLGAIRIE